MSSRDPYMVLGVAPVSPPEDIRVAYRKLSKEFHPDVNQDTSTVAAEKMKAITAAYQVVSHKQKKEDYDNQAHFQVRVPKGFAARASKSSFNKKAKPKEPSFMEKLVGLFVQKNEPKRDPEKAMTHFTMGMTMTEKAAFFGDAQAEFAQAMKADPQMVEAAYNYALMSYKLGQYDEARSGLQKVLGLAPQDRNARVLLDLLRLEDM